MRHSLDTATAREYHQGMSIWNKVLIGFISLASVVFFYMGARTLKTQQYWRELAREHQEQIDATEQQSCQLVDGGQEENEEVGLGIERLRLDLHKLLIDRGRVWYNCEPQQVDPQTGQVTVATDLPDPHRIAEKTVLYVFEEADVQQQGSYLGEFKVTAAPEKERQVQFEPSMKLTQRELQRLGRSKGPWTLYEIMPIDDNCDYEVFFKWYHHWRSVLFDLEESAERDYQYAKVALDGAQRQVALREEEVAQLEQKKVDIVLQRDAAAAHHKLLKAKVAALRAAVTRMIASNKAAAGQIAKIQLEAARQIDARTQRVAQSTAGEH